MLHNYRNSGGPGMQTHDFEESYSGYCINIPYFLDFFPPLNCSHTSQLAQAERNKSRP